MLVLDSAPSGSVGTFEYAAPHFVLEGGFLFVTLFWFFAGGAGVFVVAGDPMSPAVGDWNTVAVGALGSWMLAGGAPVVELLFEFSDFSNEGVEGAVCIDGIRGVRGIDRRIGIVGVRVRLHPVLKNGVHFVLVSFVHGSW